jgi:hypothetical protein
VKLRLHGTWTECDHVIRQLATVLRVVSISDPCPDRGRSVLVRVYLDVRLGGHTNPDGVTADLGDDVTELPELPAPVELAGEVGGDG